LFAYIILLQDEYLHTCFFYIYGKTCVCPKSVIQCCAVAYFML